MDVSGGGRAEGRRKKRLNLEDKEDRISDLPDSLLQRILSLLPSTKEAFQTSILSKRWKNQWTHVPVLIFKFDYGMFSSDNHEEAFIRFIDNTLLHHDCEKIRKLHLAYDFKTDTNFSSKIQFATRKYVEELILESLDIDGNYLLPGFLFHNASLVKLEMSYCYFRDDLNMNLGSLKAFSMVSYDYGHLVANVLSGSPLLEYLELKHSPEFVIASKSLKTLILSQLDTKDNTRIEISCPNLEELSVVSPDDMWSCNFVPHKMIEEVVSSCPLLHSLELKLCDFDQLVIASKSLKKLVLREIIEDIAIEISCPNLEDLNFCGYYYDTFKMMNTPSLVCANLNFEISQNGGCHEDMAKQIFEQLQNVKELTMGSWFIKTLSDVGIGGVSYTWSNIKILTLDGPSFEHLPVIVCALRNSPMLERLVIKCYVDECRMTADFSDLNDSREHDRNSDGTVVDCLLSHLKVVEIIGLSKHDVELKLVLNFIKFILKNARVVEKLVLVISEKPATDFTFEVSKEVSSFPRCSQHAIVELLCSK